MKKKKNNTNRAARTAGGARNASRTTAALDRTKIRRACLPQHGEITKCCTPSRITVRVRRQPRLRSAVGWLAHAHEPATVGRRTYYYYYNVHHR